MIARKWHFDCNCKRCLDPAECGLHIGSLLCKSNHCSGTVLPLQPLDPDSDFGCQRCGVTLGVKEISNITATAEEDLRKCGVGEIVENLERFLHLYSLRLHPKHQLIFTASLRLGWIYGRWRLGEIFERFVLLFQGLERVVWGGWAHHNLNEKGF